MAKKGKARRSVLAQLSPQDREAAVLEVLAAINAHHERNAYLSDVLNSPARLRAVSDDLAVPYLAVSMAVHEWAEPQDVAEWTTIHGEAV